MPRLLRRSSAQLQAPHEKYRRGITVMKLLLMASLGFGPTGCFGPCEDYAVWGIMLKVTDGQTGGLLTSDTLRAWAVDGDYIDEFVLTDFRYVPESGVVSIGFAAERASTYDVYVQADGYEPWSLEGVPVWNDGIVCRHVTTFTIEVGLQPVDFQ